MKVTVLDTTGEDFGKDAYSQLREFGVNAELDELELTEVPGTIFEKESERFMVIIRQDVKFAEEVMGAVFDLETQGEKIDKVLLEKEGSIENFRRKGRRLSQEKAETIAEEKA